MDENAVYLRHGLYVTMGLPKLLNQETVLLS